MGDCFKKKQQSERCDSTLKINNNWHMSTAAAEKFTTHTHFSDCFIAAITIVVVAFVACTIIVMYFNWLDLMTAHRVHPQTHKIDAYEIDVNLSEDHVEIEKFSDKTVAV